MQNVEEGIFMRAIGEVNATIMQQEPWCLGDMCV